MSVNVRIINDTKNLDWNPTGDPSHRLDPYDKSGVTEWTLNQLNDAYESDSIRLDGSFQRYGGVEHGSGWTKKQQRTYLDKFLKHDVENQVIMAHVDSCLEYAQRVGCHKSVSYFKECKELGYQYVSIDGFNTTSTLANWTLGRFGLHLYSQYLKKKNGGSGLITDYIERSKYAIWSQYKIKVVIYRRILIDEMTEKFRDLNTQTGLNKQENRQARITPFASFIRDVANGKGE